MRLNTIFSNYLKNNYTSTLRVVLRFSEICWSTYLDRI